MPGHRALYAAFVTPGRTGYRIARALFRRWQHIWDLISLAHRAIIRTDFTRVRARGALLYLCLGRLRFALSCSLFAAHTNRVAHTAICLALRFAAHRALRAGFAAVLHDRTPHLRRFCAPRYLIAPRYAFIARLCSRGARASSWVHRTALPRAIRYRGSRAAGLLQARYRQHAPARSHLHFASFLPGCLMDACHASLASHRD